MVDSFCKLKSLFFPRNQRLDFSGKTLESSVARLWLSTCTQQRTIIYKCRKNLVKFMLSRTSDNHMPASDIGKNVDMLLTNSWAQNAFWENCKLQVNYRFLEGVDRNSKVKVITEAVARRCSVKKRLWYRCFPVSFEKFSRISLFTEDLQWLLLHHIGSNWQWQ